MKGKDRKHKDCYCGGFIDWLADTLEFYGGMVAQLLAAAVLTFVGLIVLGAFLKWVFEGRV